MTSTTNATTTCTVTSVATTNNLTVGQPNDGCYILNFEGSSHLPFYGFPIEVIGEIFGQCFFTGDVSGFKALSCTSQCFHLSAEQFLKEKNLIKLCPSLKILDAKTQTFTDGDELDIDKLKMAKCFFELAPFVEGDAKLTVLINQAGLTLNQLVTAAEKAGITIEFDWEEILEQWGDVPVQDLEPVMISNAPITGTRHKSSLAQDECVRKVGFDGLPTLIDYLILCIAVQKISLLQICPYPQGARSSTMVDVSLLTVESSTGSIYIGNDPFGKAAGGAGARKKL